MAELTSGPAVSIIIPTYNRNDHLEECLESITKCEYDNTEIIVIDGGSNSKTEEIVSDIGANYYQQKKGQGPSPARAEGLEYATGEYVHFLDDDDRLLNGAIKRKVKILESQNDIGVVYSGIILDGGHNIYGGLKEKEHTLLPNKQDRGDVLKQALAFQLVPCSNSVLLVRKELLNDIFPLGEGPKDDLWMAVELAERTKFDYIEEPLVLRHDSEGSEGRSQAAIEEQFLVLDEKSHLYLDFPDSVRREALSDTYGLKGLIEMEKSSWSLTGISSFFKAAYFKPGFSVLYLGMGITAIFGSSIWFKIANAYVDFFMGDTHKGNI